MNQAKVQFYFDYASPWAFLADRLLARRLDGATVEHVPMYLRGVDTFARGLPYSPAKLQYLLRDFARCSAHESVAVKFPSVFPVNGLYALRGAIVAQRLDSFAAYHAAVFDAVWAQGRDLSTREAVAALAREIGLQAVAEGMEEPEVKEALRNNTDAAIARGVFGVPSFFVGDELFWGHDRLGYVARALDGMRSG
jgi:2-hydroxychromene-2-carboxylate isomerase